MTIKVAVAAHKPYRMPSDPVYLPLQVGAAGKQPICAPGGGAEFARDDAGENISGRNANWCELTGLYWAWKNLDADAIGLVHYRRHFRGARGEVSGAELERILAKADAVLPKKRNYFIETTYSQYVHAHHAQDLDATRAIIAERHAAFLPAFDASMKSTRGHRFNMFVMRRRLFDEYCTWLFDILMELERRLDISSYSPYDARVFGFVGERLLDVWLGGRSSKAVVAELPVIHLEGQHWPRKIAEFLRRKFRGRTQPSGPCSRS